MTVKIMDATLSFTCTLTNETSTMRPFGDRDKYYKDAIQFLEASDKAKEFIKKVNASEHEFEIMITDQYRRVLPNIRRVSVIAYRNPTQGSGSGARKASGNTFAQMHQ